MTSLLIIEDDLAIRQSLVNRLASLGYAVTSATTAIEGLDIAVADRPDAIVLDLGLPDFDGEDALRMIRAVSDVPVIIATARTDQSHVIRLLDAGADDYLTKPFSSEELVARLRAVLRRSQPEPAKRVIEVGGLSIDLDTRTAHLEGRPLRLRGKAFDTLAYLAGRPGKVVSKRELLAAVWHQPYGGPDKTVDVHLSWIRKELGETGGNPRFLHTERGVGVRLVDPDQTST